jgi:circadian clock protein KaiB
MTPANQAGAAALRLRLYVAGNAPNSLRAQSNLKRLCAALSHPVDVEVVDVLDAPERALTDGVMLTPTLVRLAPAPALRLVGDLSDTVKVRLVLGLDGDSNGG